ncbi:hypothetical protein Tco_0965827 [Tanacetum coccineum]
MLSDLKLPPHNPRNRAHTITIRSGLNYDSPLNPLDNSKNPINVHEISPQENGTDKTEAEKAITPSKELLNLQQLSINISFDEALEQIPKYAKFIKDFLTNKTRLEEASRVMLNERFFVVLLYKIPLKERDPMSFTIHCIIGSLTIDKALADLGQKAHILELKRRYFEDYYSNYQYAVSIKEDTAYLCLHSPKTTKDTRPICRIQERQYAVCKLYGNKMFWKISNVVPVRIKSLLEVTAAKLMLLVYKLLLLVLS